MNTISKIFLRNIKKRVLVKYTKEKIIHNYFTMTLKNAKKIKKFHSIIYFNKCTFNSDIEEDNSVDEFPIYSNRQITSTLFSTVTDDNLLNKLKELSNLQEVFSFFEYNELNLSEIHISEILLYLWNFQSLICNINGQNNTYNSHYEYVIKQKYSKDLLTHSSFKKILDHINQKFIEFSPESICIIILYLRKIGLPFSHPLMTKLINRPIKLFSENESNFTMKEISRLSAAFVSSRYLWSLLIIKDMLPFIIRQLDLCTSLKDFYPITICFQKIHFIINQEVFNKFQKKAEDLILQKESFTEQELHQIIKIIQYFSTVNEYNSKNTYNKIMLSLKGNFSKIDFADLSIVCKAMIHYKEPSSLLQEIRISALKVMENYNNNGIYDKTFIPILNFLIYTSSVKQKLNYEEIVNDHIKNGITLQYDQNLDIIKTLKFLPISNNKSYEAYWNEIFDLINIYIEQNNNLKIFNICYRYIYQNELKFRHYELERVILNWISNQLKNTQYWFLPKKMAIIGAFTLAFGPYHPSIDLEEIISHFMNMLHQFNPIECLFISKSLMFHFHNNKRPQLPPVVISRNLEINYMIKKNIGNFLSNKINSITNLEFPSRVFLNLQNKHDYALIQLIAQQCKQFFTSNLVKDQINSRNMQNLLSIVTHLNLFIPEMLNHFSSYILENSENIFGEVASSFISTCFHFDYNLNNNEELLSKIHNIIERDKHFINSLILIKSCLALSYYNYLKSSLIHHIFTLEFLEKIETEIQPSLSKEHYTKQLKYMLMKLNRSVTIDQPEEDIPWFHDKFCKDQEFLIPKPYKYFYDDILKNLEKLVGSNDFIKQHTFSPYFYKIDFLLYLNKSGNPVHFHQKDLQSITKVAIILHDHNAFPKFSSTEPELKGEFVLKRRHLEMLGYLVVDIPIRLWNAMYMSDPETKQSYLKNKIWKNFY